MRLPVLARFKSPCGLCDDPIWPDDEIVEVDGDWCHYVCAERGGHLDPDSEPEPSDGVWS